MIDTNDFIMKPNGKIGNIRHYKCYCDKCGADRGYKRNKEKDRLCRCCSNIVKYTNDNVDFNDFKLDSDKAYRLYRTNCLMCDVDKGYHRLCFATKLCHSCAMKKKWKNGTMKNAHKSVNRSFEYKGTVFKSSYEMAYAKWLDKKGISWDYEPRFDLSNGSSYFPDFKLEDGTIIEIKGYFRDDAKEKWQMFKEEYPNIKKELLMKVQLKELGVL